MGCDIHAHIEIKVTDEWHYYAPVDLWRDYAVFTKMAGVRDSGLSIEPISLPKGLPINISFTTRFHTEYLGDDGHSHSWLSYVEMQELLRFFKDELDGACPWGSRREDNSHKWDDFGIWLFGNSISGFGEHPKSYPEKLEDIRMVFWFDS